MNKPRVLLLVNLLLSVLLGWLGKDILASSLWTSFDALRNTAAIVFGVTGVWITVLYPKTLDLAHKSITHDSTDLTGRLDRARALLLPITISTIVIAISLLIQPAVLVLNQFIFQDWLIAVGRGGLFGLLSFLTVLELASIVLTIWPIHVAKGDMVSQASYDQHKGQLTKNSRRQHPDSTGKQ